MKLVVRRYVERELDRDAAWYEERQPGLREDLLEEVGATLSRIQGNPRLYPIVHLDIHRAPVRRFPFGVFYALVGDEIHVLAVVHDARHPSVWRRRR
jgi:plasmid stabilization system protein ParE